MRLIHLSGITFDRNARTKAFESQKYINIKVRKALHDHKETLSEWPNSSKVDFAIKKFEPQFLDSFFIYQQRI